MERAPTRPIMKYPRLYVLFLLSLVAVAAYIVYRAYNYPLSDLRITIEAGSYGGYTLCAFTVDDIGRDAQAPGTIYLIDGAGGIAHRWDVPGSVQLTRLKPDGNLLYTTRDRSFTPRAGLREIDPFGNVVWYYNCRADHDFHCLPNGNILIHCIDDKEAPAVGPGIIRCPLIIELTPQKEVVWEWRGEEHLRELTELAGIVFPLVPGVERSGKKVYDWAHNNSCQVIQENDAALKDPRFNAGNILFSYRNLNTIGVIDRKSGRIVWAWGPGSLDGQHSPIMMKNGNLLIFDNGRTRGYSRIIEFDPLSERIVRQYDDRDSPDPKFFSGFVSNAQPLPNGNIFVCQGDYRPPDTAARFWDSIRKRLPGNKKTVWSRLFELGGTREVVWEMVLNQRGDDTLHTMYQATRYSEDQVRPLLERLEKGRKEDGGRLHSLPYAE